MTIYEKLTSQCDALIAGPEIPVVTKNYETTAGTALKRGTLLTITAGKAAATAKGGQATAIVANDVDDKATVVTAYVSGRFFADKLIAADSDTVDSHEEELRGAGIYLATAL